MTNLERHDREWELPALSPEDERLIDAYRRTGRPADDLPYTEEFDQMCRELGTDDQAAKHEVFRRLMRLRKQGRLPRFASPTLRGRVRVSESGESV